MWAGCALRLDLADVGWHVIVVERLRHVGGRWSTRAVEGFKLPTGAFVIAMDDPLAETFNELGVEFPVWAIEERTAYLVDGKVVETRERGGLRALVSAAAAADGSDAHEMMAAIREALSGEVAVSDELLPDWLTARGAGTEVVGAIQALVQAFMALNAEEVTANSFFDYLRATAGSGRHGTPPEGSIKLAQNLADFVSSKGGEVLLGSGVQELVVADVRVTGARTRADRTLQADVDISNIGIDGTARMLPSGFDGALSDGDDVPSAPGITCFIALQQPYFDVPALVVTGTRCVCLVTTPTLVAPELAPDGWHYMETISTCESSDDESDPKREMQRHLADVEDLLPNWREWGRLLQTATYRGLSPGHDPENRFPVPGLALVGDAVKPHGWPGTGASAQSARLAVDGILEGQHLVGQ